MGEIKYHTKKEVAEMLGLNPRTVERYLLSGKLKGARLGRGWKISTEDVQAFYNMVKSETEQAIKEKQKSGKKK